MLTYIIIPVILITLNFIFISRSNRKRRYGVFPGRITLLLISITTIYYFSVLIFNGIQPAPSLKKQRKGTSLEVYQKELNQYLNQYNKREENLNTHLKYVNYLYKSSVIQGLIAFVFSLYGLATEPRRRRFYWITTASYAVSLSLVLIEHLLFV